MYPDNVAYPFGGPENSEFILLELHYDNPDLISGIATLICTLHTCDYYFKTG